MSSEGRPRRILASETSSYEGILIEAPTIYLVCVRESLIGLT